MRTNTLQGAAMYVDLYYRYQSTSKSAEDIAQIVKAIILTLDEEGTKAMQTYIRNEKTIKKFQVVLQYLQGGINWDEVVGGAGTTTLDGILAFIKLSGMVSKIEGSTLLNMVEALSTEEAMQLSVCAQSPEIISYCHTLLYYSRLKD